jgi:hypothetical protein
MKTTGLASKIINSSLSPLLAAGLLAGAALGASSPARAETPVVAEASAAVPSLALTISPVHLYSNDDGVVKSMVELTGEVKLSPRLSVAVILGAGRIKAEEELFTPEISARMLQGGIQGRYYLLGDFRHGLQLGGEAMYHHLSDSSLSLTATGPSVGAFAGYKFTARSGFTFDGQLGVQRLSARADNGEEQAKLSEVAPLLNLNVGWSF